MKQENNKQNYANLDFVKLNETLADPEFANWYYNQIMNGTDANLEMLGFVDILKKYADGEYK
ncbi:hypothetical protein LZ906_008960 [Paraclostridium ghonii]|uniref:hypothetical protein n=1 Tax=Paraclostridium ghonii TaxID=29358 RepID=UPI00202CA952|nr:hypothetical protein [Paeniclostridium ghonii]MCM0166397.1 hypothetical protein [Paeniclostridium ghonii]